MCPARRWTCCGGPSHAQQLGNITPLQCDLLTSRRIERSMTQCSSAFSEVSRRSCPWRAGSAPKRLIIIKKNYASAPAFSDRSAHSRRDELTAGLRDAPRNGRSVSRLTRRNWSTGSRLHRWTMLSGFSASTAGTRTPAQLHAETVLPRLRRTEDVQYPYYLPQTKRLGILTIRMEDLV